MIRQFHYVIKVTDAKLRMRFSKNGLFIFKNYLPSPHIGLWYELKIYDKIKNTIMLLLKFLLIP